MRKLLAGFSLIALAGCAASGEMPAGKSFDYMRNSTCGVSNSIWDGMTLEEKIAQEYKWAHIVQTQGKPEQWSKCRSWKSQRHANMYRAQHNGKSYECPVVGENSQVCKVMG